MLISYPLTNTVTMQLNWKKANYHHLALSIQCLILNYKHFETTWKNNWPKDLFNLQAPQAPALFYLFANLVEAFASVWTTVD